MAKSSGLNLKILSGCEQVEESLVESSCPQCCREGLEVGCYISINISFIQMSFFSLMYFIPLTLLGAYFAWRSYA